MRTIYLVRHGRSAHGGYPWLDRPALLRWLAAYDAAGVAENDSPPRVLRRDHGYVVSSDMPRAIESAHHLDPRYRTTPLLREAAMIIPNLRMRLPIALWALAVFERWSRAMRSGEWPSAEDHKRGEEAAAWLDALSEEHATVTAVTHRAFRHILVPALEARGWKAHGKRRGHHWSVRTLTKA